MLLSFMVLGWIGTRIYQEKPPIPAKVVTTDGTALIAEGEVEAGQNVWQSLGGMEVGSVWGHGSYVAPDWTADWLHREATFILDRWATAEFGAEYAKLEGERQAQLTIESCGSRGTGSAWCRVLSWRRSTAIPRGVSLHSPLAFTLRRSHGRR